MAETQVKDYLTRLAAIQDEIVEELTVLERAELKYATDNARWNTVRRVLLRFGDHLREHTTQLVAARESIGAAQTMPQRMLARAQEAYGALLGASVGLQDAQLDRIPEPGEWTPRQILEHMLSIQRAYLNLVHQGRQMAQPVDKD